MLLLLAACIPHLYTDDTSDTEEWEWVAPDNDWSMSAPPEGLRGTGYAVGDVLPDFRLLDQHGQTVSLWQFYGSVLVVDVSTMWCSPCQDLAQHADATYQDYLDDGFMYLTVLAENTQGGDPIESDLSAWASEFDITAPILADPGKEWSAPGMQGDYPLVLIVDREMRVEAIISLPPTDSAVRAAVEALL